MHKTKKAIVILGITGILAQLTIGCSQNQVNYSHEASQIAQDSEDEEKSIPLKSRSVDISINKSERAENRPQPNTEQYDRIYDNTFKLTSQNPLSTFSIDVDTASYSNVRRFLSYGQLPPQDAVRIEELINYFHYDYPQPQGDKPFSINTEISESPWNKNHQLVRIGLQGKKMATENLPASNLVFLIDVSGSMNQTNKLPLLKSSMRLLVSELSAKDRVAIVVYAGAAGVVLPPTPGNEKRKILEAIDNLGAGGYTAGSEGIKLAYEVAKNNFIESGNNRVILATDGDFNVGVSSDAELVRLIEEKREEDVFITVLGFGIGNLKDAKMEKLANKGNGNYAYIDNIREARKVLVKEIGATLFTIAKDVKIQVEFNPAKVKSYRLIGYVNRQLSERDFKDDTKDAGELGAGHSVTALYEIIPVGVNSDDDRPESLRYQQKQVKDTAYNSDELMLVKLRYKQPDANNSELITQPIMDKKLSLEMASNDFRFAAAVAAFGMVLRDSKYKGNANLDLVLNLAQNSQGADLDGYRADFIELVKTAKKIKTN
ncbi:MAG: VWA domain-containing protein [Prochloraceae cyanobacterium]|nr:VWA domain-containing protein [Prochloraceae cyanobacterium]